MISSCVLRFISTARSCWSAEKSLLASLRKKTGYTFSNCKKALELNNNDLNKAETWLREQAQAMGWTKVSKFEGRKTTQGLIAVAIKDNYGTIVEVNCETDFVARNQNFEGFVKTAAASCLYFASRQQPRFPLTKMHLDTEQLNALKTNDGKSLSDQLALLVGSLSENTILRRAVCFKVEPGTHLASYSHPSLNSDSDILLGKYGALLAYKTDITDYNLLGKQLCQHIVGMNPLKVGSEDDKPCKNAEDEKCLIYQEYVLNEEVKVGEVLKENRIEIVDFQRFGCGEIIT